MGLVTGIVVYVILWWIIFFTMLPVGVRTHGDEGTNFEAGHAESAPIKANMLRKVLLTTLISAVVWLAYYWFEGAGLVTLRPDFQGAGQGTP